MTSEWNLVVYVIAIITAAGVLTMFRASAWYLHVTGVAVGLLAGLMPPVGAAGEAFYLIAGTTFCFFTTWGIGGFFVPPALPRRTGGAGHQAEHGSLIRSDASPEVR